jgi:hypothetical protein
MLIPERFDSGFELIRQAGIVRPGSDLLLPLYGVEFSLQQFVFFNPLQSVKSALKGLSLFIALFGLSIFPASL